MNSFPQALRNRLLSKQRLELVSWLMASVSAGVCCFPAEVNAAEEEGVKLEEMIVTAQRRSERLQDVPIAISVLSGEHLDRSTAEGTTEALSQVPGVATTIGLQGGGTQVAIRGVSASAATFFGSSPIAYYLDSVPFGFIKNAVAPDASAYDLERVEVLRGPQGTLYGASAQNGVVRILSNDADLEELKIKARTSLSTTDGGGENYRGDLAVNVPIVEGKLAARAVVGYQDLSGWIDTPVKNDFNSAELRNMRLKVNALPTEALSIGVSAWLSRADYDGPSISDDQQRHRSVVNEPIKTDYDAFSLKVGYNFGGVSLTSMTSYLDYSNDSWLDFLTYINIPDVLYGGLDSSVVAQEINLQSNYEGPWRWSLGAIYRDVEDRLYQTLFCCIPGGINDQRDFSKSFAVFGEATRAFLDGRLEVTAGLRYFEDDVTNRGNTQTLPPAPAILETKKTFDATSPRLVFTWHPRDELTIYASYAEGFRSGFDQVATVKVIQPDFPPADADTLTNYEFGSKGAFLDGRVSFDAALYYIDWQDVQQSVTVLLPSGAGFNALINGTSASGVGVDLGLNFRPMQDLQLSLTLSWNDLSMDGPVQSGNIRLFEKGDRLNNSSEYIAGASGEYRFPIGRFDARFAASANYASEQDFRSTLGVLMIGEGDAMLVGRTSFALEFPERWTGTLFVDNVSNERGSALRPPWGVTDWDARIRPRTIGLQLDYRF